MENPDELSPGVCWTLLGIVAALIICLGILLQTSFSF